MKGKKRVVSRKRQALRWTAVLVLLVWLSHTTGAYCLTPTRVLRSLEREQLTGETEFLAEIDAPSGVDGTMRLSGGDHAVILAHYAWRWKSGWCSNMAGYVERYPDWPFNAMCSNSWHSPNNGRAYYIFGAVEDPEVTKLEVYFDAASAPLDQTVYLTEDDWIRDEKGNCFFLCEIKPGVRVMTLDCSIRGYRADGSTVGMLELLPVIPRWE